MLAEGEGVPGFEMVTNRPPYFPTGRRVKINGSTGQKNKSIA